MRSVIKNSGSLSGNSIAARIVYAILALGMFSVATHDVIVGRTQGRSRTFIVYRESEPQLYWIIVCFTLAGAFALGFMAIRKQTLQK